MRWGRRSFGGYDEDEYGYPAPRRQRQTNWRLWLGLAVLGAVLVSCPLLLIFLVALIHDPQGTSIRLTNFFDESVTIMQWGVPTVVTLGILYLLRHVIYAFLVKPLHALGERFPMTVNLRGRVTMHDDQQPRWANTRTYSPRQQTMQPMVDADEPEDMPALPPPRPMARELIEQGRVGQGDFLLGVDATGAEVRRTQKQFVSYFIAGVQGGGKTTTACWLLAQALLAGGQMALIDWDAQSEEGLYQKLRPFKRAFALPVGDTPESTLMVISYTQQLLEDRIAGRARMDKPFVLAVDEFSYLMQQRGKSSLAGQAADELVDLLEFLNTRGRKYLVSVICIGQATNASRAGGSEVRDLFNDRLAHAMQGKQAQLLGLTEYKQAIMRLGKGEVYADLRGYAEPFLLYVPYLTDDDMRLVARRLPEPIRSSSGYYPTLPGEESEEDADAPTLPSWPDLPPEEQTLANYDRYLGRLRTGPLSGQATTTTATTSTERPPAPITPIWGRSNSSSSTKRPKVDPRTRDEIVRLYVEEHETFTGISRRLFGVRGGEPFYTVKDVLREAGLLPEEEAEQQAAIATSVGNSDDA